MGSLKLVLFDCDGTLADSHGFLTNALMASFRAVGADMPPSTLLKSFYSLHFDEFFKRCDSHLSPEQIVAASQHMRQTLIDGRNSGAVVEPLYDGIKEMLSALGARGILLGVVTNKGSHGVHSVLNSNAIAHHFVTVRHVDSDTPKPAPDMVLSGLKEAGVDRENCLLVGDSVIDMLTARNAGVRPVAVTWAGRDEAELHHAGAVAVAHQVPDLLPILLNLLGEA